jgi:hypothetical protein
MQRAFRCRTLFSPHHPSLYTPTCVAKISCRRFAKETKRAFDPPPDAPSNSNMYAIIFGVSGLAGLAYLFSLERNDYGISWYADQNTDASRVPVSVPRPRDVPEPKMK